MSGCTNCTKFQNENEYLDFFFKAPTYIDPEIESVQLKTNRFWLDMIPKEPIPYGVGSNYQKLIVHRNKMIPFAGLSIYERLQETDKPASAFSPAHSVCSYPPTHRVPGLGYERMGLEGYRTAIRSEDICVDKLFSQQIAPEEFFHEWVENLADYALDIKEYTNRNIYFMYAQKYIAAKDENGDLLHNMRNIRDFPLLAAADVKKVSAPSYSLLLYVYETYLLPYISEFQTEMSDGEPNVILACDPIFKSEIVEANAKIVRHLEYSSMADNLLKKYAPLDKIGPFIFKADAAFPRFTRDTITNEIKEVHRWIHIPVESGYRAVPNPDYDRAPFYGVMPIPQKPFKMRTRQLPTRIGGATFGERVYDLSMQWIQIKDRQDFLGKTGFYYGEYEFFIEPGRNVDYPLILFKRRTIDQMFVYWDNPVCPPSSETVCAGIEVSGCPCPVITGFKVDTFNGAIAEVTIEPPYATPLTAGTVVSFESATGGTITGTVQAPGAAPDGITYKFLFTTGGKPLLAEDFVGVQCDAPVYECSAEVVGVQNCGAAITGALDLLLSRNIRCRTTDQDVRIYFNDGTSLVFDITAANVNTHVWTVTDPTNAVKDYNACCFRGGIKSICCVPLASDPEADPPVVGNDCEACGAELYVTCAGDEIVVNNDPQ